MTREHKLALIVGFALVLVVGVLVSDHFSSARQTQPGGGLIGLGPREAGGSNSGLDNATDSRLGEDVSIGRIQDRPMVLPDTTPRGTPSAVTVTGNWNNPGGTSPFGAPIDDPLAAGNTPQAGSYPSGFQHQSQIPVGPGADLSPYGFHRTDIAQGPPTIDMSGGLQPSPAPDVTVVQTEIVPNPGGVPNAGRNTPSAPMPLGPQALPPAAKPKPRTYTVREGDSLYAIARKELGDGNKWLVLRDTNRKLVGDEGELLQPGMKLTLPGTAQADNSAVPGTNGPGGVQPKPTGAAGGTYTVQSGDVLSVIAQKTLGSAKRWREILAANRGTIEDADSLTVGMVLKIPAR